MSSTKGTKPAVWFWVVGVLALIWNAMGVFAYIAEVTMSPDAVAELSEAERALRASAPAWYTGAFAIAVFAGTVGCAALLIRRRWALWLLVASFAGVILQQLYFFLLSDVGASLESGALIMTITIPIVAALLIWFARVASAREWLR